MELAAHRFKEQARTALDDRILQDSFARIGGKFGDARSAAVAGLPEFDALRDEGLAIKSHVLDHLDVYLERFEAAVTARGGKVHWAATPAEAREAILAVARAAGARTVTKGKSMVAEEIGLNPFLEQNGVEPIETDLGEYIIQLADEPPSHIIAPAVHKTKAQVSDLFHEHHARYGKTRKLTDGGDLVAEAREVLRQKYIDADMGITGANFLVAETGSTVIVTNEGNGDLTQSLPRVHLVLASIEKVVPTLEDVSTLLRILARSATGQEMSVYTTFSTGPKRDGDLDGPEEFHVVLLDNGRSRLLGGPASEVLRCIRCGACMNHCPVYRAVGGHAYGWVYPGPIGAAIDPHFLGVKEAYHLPQASSFCGRCEEVCPMRIPLPKIMRHWREEAFRQSVTPAMQRHAVRAWAWLAARPRLYRIAARLAARGLALAGGRRGRAARLPFAGSWTAGRDMPAPEGRSFHDLWAARGREGRH
ncbi:LutB/LldF family L-lactate oxidation iron-sulfur protein [Marinibaculum pumilum]|uniref:LutB/LldF family L-lactate oxidation iron-sulfur protein n=1 Tax=Marinibaculum pumilum TaxID=1766165 RepID=A0ABV7KUT2_9PROT